MDLVLEHLQRQRAGIEHLLVELADVEFRAERGLGFVAQAADGQLAELVGERLAGDGDVALDLGSRVGLRFARVGQEIVDRPIARPAL